MLILPKPRRVARRGASVVEFAFIVPVLMLLLLGILEYSRFLFTVQVMNNAAREGARYAVVNTAATLTTTDIQNYVDSYMAGTGAQLSGYSATGSISVFQASATTGLDNSGGWANTSWGQPIGVTVSGTYNPIVPGMLFLTGSLTVQATCIMYCEAN